MTTSERLALQNQSTRRRHEVRDENGHLIAVIDIVGDDRVGPAPGMIELAADIGVMGYRVRIFGPVETRQPRAA